MTNHEASALIAKAQAKASKFSTPVVLNTRTQAVQLLRSFSPTRQAAILAGTDGEILINPPASL